MEEWLKTWGADASIMKRPRSESDKQQLNSSLRCWHSPFNAPASALKLLFPAVPLRNEHRKNRSCNLISGPPLSQKLREPTPASKPRVVYRSDRLGSSIANGRPYTPSSPR